MSFLKSIEQDIRKLVNDTPEEELADTLVKYAKAKVYESYKNGVTIGQGKKLDKNAKAQQRGTKQRKQS